MDTVAEADAIHHQSEAGAAPETATEDIMASNRIALRAMLLPPQRRGLGSEFPRSATMRAIIKPRNRTLLIAAAAVVTLWSWRRLPVGRAAAALNLIRIARAGVNLMRH